MIIYLLYKKSVDIRICLMLSNLQFKVETFSNIEKLKCSYRGSGLVIIDVDSDLDSAFQTVNELITLCNESQIICVCRNGSTEFFRECFRAGLIDVVDKSFDDHCLTEAFSSVRTSLCARYLSFISLRQRQLRYQSLTDREREVFCYLLDGLTSREIGKLLALSPRTVEAHRARVRKKLYVENTAQMAGLYRELITKSGVITLAPHSIASN